MHRLSKLHCVITSKLSCIFCFGLVLIISSFSSHAQTLSDRLAKDPTSIAVYDRHGIKVDPTNFEQLDFLKANEFKNSKSINLTIDIQANKILDEEIQAGIQKYKALGAGGILIDANTGEIIAITSKYTDHRNLQFNAEGDARFNMITEGVYEIGSTAKLLTIANAVENKLANSDTKIDARKPLKIGKHEIGDYHATNRILTLDEAFLHSSNIAISKLALKAGPETQSDFMKKIGFNSQTQIMYMENSEPIMPKRQSKLITATTSFGHGFAVTPIHAVVAMSAFVNGGHMITPSIVKQDVQLQPSQVNIISSDTSAYIRHLLALNVEKGSGTKAKVDGIDIGGQTSTAEKLYNGHYMQDKLFSTFITTFPIDKPRYVLMTLFDEPQGLPETYGFATAGWNAAVVAGNAIKRLVPVLKLD